jgi:hypothetical protein
MPGSTTSKCVSAGLRGSRVAMRRPAFRWPW